MAVHPSFQPLAAEHFRLSVLATKLEKRLNGARAASEVERIAADILPLASELIVDHLAREKQVVLPLIADHVEPDGDRLHHAAIDDQRAALNALAGLRHYVANGHDLREPLAALVEAMRHHVNLYDSHALPWLAAHTPSATLMQTREALAAEPEPPRRSQP